MSEIEQAINQGKEVITHTDAVSVPGYSGAGYIILDPITGDGAYKIAGGENGGGHKPSLISKIALLIGMSPDDGLSAALAAIGFLMISATGDA